MAACRAGRTDVAVLAVVRVMLASHKSERLAHLPPLHCQLLSALAEVMLDHPQIRAKHQSGSGLLHDESQLAGKAEDRGQFLAELCYPSAD